MAEKKPVSYLLSPVFCRKNRGKEDRAVSRPEPPSPVPTRKTEPQGVGSSMSDELPAWSRHTDDATTACFARGIETSVPPPVC